MGIGDRKKEEIETASQDSDTVLVLPPSTCKRVRQDDQNEMKEEEEEKTEEEIE